MTKYQSSKIINVLITIFISLVLLIIWDVNNLPRTIILLIIYLSGIYALWSNFIYEIVLNSDIIQVKLVSNFQKRIIEIPINKLKFEKRQTGGFRNSYFSLILIHENNEYLIAIKDGWSIETIDKIEESLKSFIKNIK